MGVIRSFDTQYARIDRDGVATVQLQPLRLTVAIDSSWSPYVQVTLTCSKPSQADLDLIDPRQPSRLRFQVVQQQQGVADKVRQFDLHLRSRRRSAKTGDLVIRATSDESLLMDWASGNSFLPDVWYSGDGPIHEGFKRATGIDPYTSSRWVEDSGISSSTIATEDDARWTPGEDAWGYLTPFVEAAKSRLWCDERAIWHWTRETWADPTATPVLGADTVLDVDDVIDRDDEMWANYVIVRYTGNSPEQYDFDSSADPARKALIITRSRRTPTAGAAGKIRRAAVQRGRTIQVDAIAEIGAAPSQTWRAQYDGEDRTGLLQSVSFTFPEGTMRQTLDIV